MIQASEPASESGTPPVSARSRAASAVSVTGDAFAIGCSQSGSVETGTKTELKNMNSFRFVMQGINAEIARQTALLENGEAVTQETLHFDPTTGQISSLRSKEEAHDYRYFPDPDLLPLELTQAEVDALKAHLPELPDEKKARFVREGLSAYDADVLVAERATADFFEAVAKGRDPKAAANWVINDLTGRLNKESKDISASPVSARQLGDILDLIGEGTISGKIAKDLFEIVWSEGGDPRAIVEARGLKQVTDTGAIEKVVDEVLAANPDKVDDVKTNPKALGWFVGQVMKASRGKADPALVNELLRKKLE